MLLGDHGDGRRAWILRVRASMFSVSALSSRLKAVFASRSCFSSAVSLLIAVSRSWMVHDFFAVDLEVIERFLVPVGLTGLRKEDQRRRASLVERSFLAPDVALVAHESVVVEAQYGDTDEVLVLPVFESDSGAPFDHDPGSVDDGLLEVRRR
jgi:hypothetical protein